MQPCHHGAFSALYLSINDRREYLRIPRDSSSGRMAKRGGRAAQALCHNKFTYRGIEKSPRIWTRWVLDLVRAGFSPKRHRSSDCRLVNSRSHSLGSCTQVRKGPDGGYFWQTATADSRLRAVCKHQACKKEKRSINIQVPAGVDLALHVRGRTEWQLASRKARNSNTLCPWDQAPRQSIMVRSVARQPVLALCEIMLGK
ncbi:hypothetical protein V8F33_009706 [Rhypophila sp. PSN 637]